MARRKRCTPLRKSFSVPSLGNAATATSPFTRARQNADGFAAAGARFAVVRSCLWLGLWAACWVLSAAACGGVWAGEGSEPPKYELRYRFVPGETIRWNVVHRNQVKTTVAGATKTVETASRSVKVWRVRQLQRDGSAVFEQAVEDIDMRHHLSGCDEVRYNSRTDKEPPPGFDDVASAVGVPLATVTLDSCGRVVKREQKTAKAQAPTQGDITMPLPEQPVAVGETWTKPSEVTVTAKDGRLIRVKMEQRFTLEEVKTGVARICMKTIVLTPIRDPAVEAQVVQFAVDGEVRFDIDAGRIRSQRTEVDRHVVGFRGETSSIRYVTCFEEELQNQPARAAVVSVGEADRQSPKTDQPAQRVARAAPADPQAAR